MLFCTTLGTHNKRKATTVALHLLCGGSDQTLRYCFRSNLLILLHHRHQCSHVMRTKHTKDTFSCETMTRILFTPSDNCCVCISTYTPTTLLLAHCAVLLVNAFRILYHSYTRLCRRSKTLLRTVAVQLCST